MARNIHERARLSGLRHLRPSPQRLQMPRCPSAVGRFTCSQARHTSNPARSAVSPPEVIVHHDAGLLARAVAARLVTKLVDALKSLGDLQRDFSVDRLFLPGVTQVAD